MAAHRELDNIESQLALLQARQETSAHKRDSSKKGRVEQLDLRALIDLDQDLEELDTPSERS